MAALRVYDLFISYPPPPPPVDIFFLSRYRRVVVFNSSYQWLDFSA